MITILKGTSVEVHWRIIRTENKITEDFTGSELRVFLVGPDNVYPMECGVEAVEGYNEIRFAVDSKGLSTGVYDLKAVWVKNKHSIPNVVNNQFMSVSRRGGVLAVTDDPSEVTLLPLDKTIKLMSYVESYGRDGMSAYELAAFRGVLPEGMSEAEWANQENVRQQNEEKRIEAEDERREAEDYREAYEHARKEQESVRVKNENDRKAAEATRQSAFTANEEERQSTFDTNETNREAEFGKAIQSAKDNLIVVNDLTTGGADKALSAEMGKLLDEKTLDLVLPASDNINNVLLTCAYTHGAHGRPPHKGNEWFSGFVFMNTFDGVVHYNQIAISAINPTEIYSRLVTRPTNNIENITYGEWKLIGSIADGSITTTKLATYSVTSEKLGTCSVSQNKIAPGAVTEDKLSPSIAAKINGALPEKSLLPFVEITNGNLDSAIDTGMYYYLDETGDGPSGELVDYRCFVRRSSTTDKDGQYTIEQVAHCFSYPMRVFTRVGFNSTDETGTNTDWTDWTELTQNNFELSDGIITTNKLADESVTIDKLADESVSRDKLTPALGLRIDSIPTVVNDLTIGGTTAALSAEMGKSLNDAKLTLIRPTNGNINSALQTCSFTQGTTGRPPHEGKEWFSGFVFQNTFDGIVHYSQIAVSSVNPTEIYSRIVTCPSDDRTNLKFGNWERVCISDDNKALLDKLSGTTALLSNQPYSKRRTIRPFDVNSSLSYGQENVVHKYYCMGIVESYSAAAAQYRIKLTDSIPFHRLVTNVSILLHNEASDVVEERITTLEAAQEKGIELTFSEETDGLYFLFDAFPYFDSGSEFYPRVQFFVEVLLANSSVLDAT